MSSVVSIAYFTFMAGCVLFAIAGVAKTVFALRDTGGNDELASWVGWTTGFASATATCHRPIVADSQIHVTDFNVDGYDDHHAAYCHGL